MNVSADGTSVRVAAEVRAAMSALTMSQERAIRFARRALDQAQADDRPADIPPERAGDYWRGYLAETLGGLLEALEVTEE